MSSKENEKKLVRGVYYDELPEEDMSETKGSMGKEEKPLIKGVTYDEAPEKNMAERSPEAGEKLLTPGVIYDPLPEEETDMAERDTEAGEKPLIRGVIYDDEDAGFGDAEGYSAPFDGCVYGKDANPRAYMTSPAKGEVEPSRVSESRNYSVNPFLDSIAQLKKDVESEHSYTEGVPFQSSSYDELEKALHILKGLEKSNNRKGSDVTKLSNRQRPNSLPSDAKGSNVVSADEVSEVVPSSLLNFELELIRHILAMYDTENGQRSEHHYLIAVTVHLKTGVLLKRLCSVEASKAKEIGWLKKGTDSLATVPRGKEAMEEYQNMVQECIENLNVPTEITYPSAGWRNVPEYGWHYVYGDGTVGLKDGFVHTFCVEKYTLDLRSDRIGQIETFNLAMGMCNICKNMATSTELFLFVHASLLSELYKQAGHPINFVFGIIGVTNSRKTSLATTVAKVFRRKELIADAEFATATESGIEKALAMYKDAPVLIDDFKPGMSKGQQNKMNDKLDLLLRLCGNRVAKKRMTDFMPDGEKKYFPIEGGCVVTMEIVEGVLSSLTRLFMTEIDTNEVMNDRLQYYQDEVWILPTHIYDFLWWVTDNFERIVNFIKDKFIEFRLKYQFEMQRSAEMYATLFLVAVLLAGYAQERTFWEPKDAEGFLAFVDKILFAELKNMDKRLHKKDKGVLTLEVFRDLLYSGAMTPTPLNEQNAGLKHDFYEDERMFYVRAKKLRIAVNDYCRRSGETMNIINEDEMIKLLERLNVLDIAERDGKRERSRKLPIQRGNTFRYLHIKKSGLWESLE